MVSATRLAGPPPLTSVGDRAPDPWAFILLHKCCRRAGAPFVDPERRARRRRIVEDRSRSPVETLAMLRRQKKRRVAVGKTERPVIAKLLWGQRFRRELGPGDQCLILTQPERHHALIDFERVLRRFVDNPAANAPNLGRVRCRTFIFTSGFRNSSCYRAKAGDGVAASPEFFDRRLEFRRRVLRAPAR